MTTKQATPVHREPRKLVTAKVLKEVSFIVSFLLALFLCGVWVKLFSATQDVVVVLGWVSLACLAIHLASKFALLYFEGRLTLK